MSWVDLVLAALVLAIALVAGAYITAVLDVGIGRIVARVPMRFGDALMLPARRAAVLVLQQRAETERPDAPLWALAPALLATLAAGALLVIPLAPALAFPAVDSGIVYFGALMAMVMVAVYLNGWAANSLFPMIGGYRFVAQALSYEMPLALVLIGAALPAESLSIDAIVRSQAGVWNVVRQPLGLPLYLVAALGLAFWGPLAFPDAPDLAGGTEAELSGIALLAWRAARAMLLVAVSAMGAAAFLGGWLGPLLPPPLWLAVKTLAVLALLITAGHLVARMRLERFVVIAWTVLIPLALIDVFEGGIVTLLAGHR